MSAIIKTGLTPKKDIGIGIDVGSSELYNRKTKKYIFRLDSSYFSSTNLINLYENWLSRYPIISIEDGLAEDDWLGWQEWNKKMGKKILIIGDDLFVTNIDRFCKGIENKAANTILIKLNQIGTVSETLDVIKFAQIIGFNTIISHRSGDSEDTFIADLAVGTNSNQIKTGSLARSERVAKYNQLIRIEEELGKKARMNKIH